MTDEPQPFLLPVSYWPQRSATYWWDDFRQEEVLRDFNLASAAGVSLLHLSIPWQTSQPHSERVSVTLMRDLETALRMAADMGIRTLVTVAAASIFGLLTLPHWFYELTADDHSRPTRVLRRLYEDPLLVGATRKMVGELTGEFGDHPGIEGWVIGDGLLATSPPRSPEHVDEWLDGIRSVAQVRGKRVWHGVSARDIAQQRALRLGSLGQAGFGTLIHVDWKPHWAHDTRLWSSFLVSFTRRLGGLPPLVAGTARYPFPASDAEEDSVESDIGEARSAGAAGLIWPALFDYDPQLRSRPPFTSAAGELTRGLLGSGVRMSAAAMAWLDASGHGSQVTSPSSPQLDEQLRDREPEDFIRMAYDDFVS
jgi:hypothetical protein